MKNNIKNIVFIGAFDRNNYGDLLFPLLLSEYFSLNGLIFNYSYVGLKSVDMRPLLTCKTEALYDNLKKSENNKIDICIVVGGEVLDPDFFQMFLCFRHNWLLQKLHRFLQKMEFRRLANKIGKMLLGYSHELPWILGEKDFTRKVKIFYNTVGGAPPNFEFKLGVKKLSGASFVSIRDSHSYHTLIPFFKNHPHFHLFPDSATAMSHIFKLEELPNRLSEVGTTFHKVHSKYIVFQTSLHLAKNNYDTIVNELISLNKELKLNIILLPIGYAPMHSDHIALKIIHNRIPNITSLISNNNIFDTMSIIANSQLFLGTSLHGCITAISFKIPFVGFNTNNFKLISYFKTWAENRVIIFNFNELHRQAIESINNVRYFHGLHSTINLAIENLEKLKDAVIHATSSE